MPKKLLFLLSIIVFANDSIAKETVNNLYLVVGSGFNNFKMTADFVLGNALVPDKYNQSTEGFSIRPMDQWHGVYIYNYWAPYRGDTSYGVTSLLIEVYASRKGSVEVAQWAASQQSAIMNNYNKGKVYAKSSTNSIDDAPYKLNFAFIGDLKINYAGTDYTCYNVIIGQGHSGAYNNWWIYSNYWPINKNGAPAKNGAEDRIQCVYMANNSSQLQRFAITKQLISNDTFNLSLADSTPIAE